MIDDGGGAAPAVPSDESGLSLEVGPSEAGTRLDVLLVRRVEGMSRARARRLIEDGQVRVNGSRARKGARLSVADRVELETLPPPVDFVPVAVAGLPVSIVYEDAFLVAADKPAGMPSHPLRPHERDTLVNALLHRYPDMVGVGYANRESGLVHRLDNDTSGLVLAARSQAIFEALRAELKAGRIDKAYLALVVGELEPMQIDLPIAPDPTDPRRVRAEDGRRRPGARPASSRIVQVRRVADASLVEVRASVAVRHQIRAHLAAIGHPLVGDWLYGGPHLAGLSRHFLHASELDFVHPRTGRRIELRSPLPPELERALSTMRAA